MGRIGCASYAEQIHAEVSSRDRERVTLPRIPVRLTRVIGFRTASANVW